MIQLTSTRPMAPTLPYLAMPENVLLITPAWVPFARELIIASGVIEIAASLALVTRIRLRWWAGVINWPGPHKDATGS
ncbi:putative membrane protein [Tardiphaga robiniae]|uniref:hypothetical protein n=1 Tax=Tardiphaga robiniae TaxID=943830 RepID=UPI00285EA6B1|nr:hypothetical protein [Tardiphaga robiniae]MDR6661428.1 putative membrane protein [Tardiphaga robiniae]